MNGEVLSVMNIKTNATVDTKKSNNVTKINKSNFKKTFEEVKNNKNEKKSTHSKKKESNVDNSKEEIKATKENNSKVDKADKVDQEKIKTEKPKKEEALEKVDQQTLKKVKDLLEKLGIEVSDEVLNQLAMKFDFKQIIDTLSSMKFINNNGLDLSSLLETINDLTDSLESMKNFLMDQPIPELSENEVKMKFDNLLNQLNGKVESVEVSESTKEAKESIKELMTFVKDNFVSLEESSGQRETAMKADEEIVGSESAKNEEVLKEDAKKDLKTFDDQVAKEDKIDDSGSKKVTSKEAKSEDLEMKNEMKSPSLEISQKEVVVKEDVQMNFKEELNFRLLSKSQQSVKVFDQIKETLSTKFDGKVSEMKVLLDPKSLGKVELKLTIEKGNVLAEFEVQNMTVKQAIESNLQDLRNALSDKGYALEGLDVSVNQDKQEEDNQKQQYFENIFETTDDDEKDPIALIEESKMLNILNRRAISYLGYEVCMQINGSFSEEQLNYLESIQDNQENNKLIENQEMGQDAFLKLLMAEMENQDPLNPMDSKDTVAQMAQFSTVEQLTKVSESVEKGNQEAKESVLQIENAIAKLNNNFVDGGTLQTDKLDEINDNQKELLNEMIKLNKSISAYFTESNTSTGNI